MLRGPRLYCPSFPGQDGPPAVSSRLCYRAGGRAGFIRGTRGHRRMLVIQLKLPNQLRRKGNSLQQELCHLPSQEPSREPSHRCPDRCPLPRLPAGVAENTWGCKGECPWGTSYSDTSPVLLKSSSWPSQSILASNCEAKSSFSSYRPPSTSPLCLRCICNSLTSSSRPGQLLRASKPQTHTHTLGNGLAGGDHVERDSLQALAGRLCTCLRCQGCLSIRKSPACQQELHKGTLAVDE